MQILRLNCIILLGIALILCLLSIQKYTNLHSSFWDLGVLYSEIWKISNNYLPITYIFHDHSHIFFLYYSFLLHFWESPVLILFCQNLIIIIVIFLIVRLFSLNNFQKLLIYFLFFLYPPIWYNCLFDFHFEHLFVLFCAIFFSLVFGRWSVDKKDYQLQTAVKRADYRLQIAIFFVSFLCCLVKEVFALSAAMMGVYIIIRKKWWITGLLIVMCSLSYFFLVELYLIPLFSEGKDAASLFQGSFSHLGGNIKEIIVNLLIHPWLIVTEGFSEWRKIFYVIVIFGPFLFIPLLAPLELLPGLPQLFISLLSHNPNHYAIGHQYTAGLIVPVFIAFLKGMPRAGSLWSVVSGRWSKFWQYSAFTIQSSKKATDHRLLPTDYKLLVVVFYVSLVFHILLSPSPISRLFWTNKAWNYGYEAYIPTERDCMIKEAIKKYIPSDPEVAVSTQNTLNWGYLAHRRYYFAFPIGAVEPYWETGDRRQESRVKSQEPRAKGQKSKDERQASDLHPQASYSKPIYAQYILIDLKRPWFVGDRGCNWQIGKPLKLTEAEIKRLGLSEDPGPLKWAGCANEVEVSWLSPSGRVYKGTLKEVFLRLVAKAIKDYKILYEKDGFLIFKRY